MPRARIATFVLAHRNPGLGICGTRKEVVREGAGKGNLLAKFTQDVVKLYPYRDQWHKAYIKEKKVIEKELGGYVFENEHIGSTAVPEMSSTLNIDILIGIDELAEIAKFEPILTAMGYSQSDISHGPKHRLYICDSQQGYHLHFLETRILKNTPYVKFRDALIRDPKLAKEYKEYKIRLVGNFKCNSTWYAAEKSKWITAWLKQHTV